MLDDTRSEKAARLLDRLWREGREVGNLPETLKPRTRAEGYAVQAALERQADGDVLGWKIAATSRAGQAHINVDGPLAGRIFSERVLEPGAEIPLRGNNMRVAELEFAFRMARDLPPRAGGHGADAVRGAVDALVPAVELPASRYADYRAVGAPALIADNSCAHLFVFGTPFEDAVWRDRDLKDWTVSAEVAGRGVTEGAGRNVLGDPWTALAWLVEECSAHGIALKAGQLVSTGTCLVPVPVSEGDMLTADFGAGEPTRLRFA